MDAFPNVNAHLSRNLGHPQSMDTFFHHSQIARTRARNDRRINLNISVHLSRMRCKAQ